ncbi:MAG: cation:proton antiporter, partial [Methanolinea sp.]|nr:cation:proton antiporter [Methanolinea sp.]
MESIFLLELMVILILSLLVLFVCNYLKIPLIIGYILSGVLVGPFVLGFVGSTQIIELVAEIGVIFLLFTIGIQYSLKSLFEAKKLVVLGGALQMVITTLCVMALALLFGTPANVAVFLGLLVSLSSTAIVMKVLQERGELESLHGKTTLSIMIFQDLMLIPLMFITPLL